MTDKEKIELYEKILRWISETSFDKAAITYDMPAEKAYKILAQFAIKEGTRNEN